MNVAKKSFEDCRQTKAEAVHELDADQSGEALIETNGVRNTDLRH